MKFIPETIGDHIAVYVKANYRTQRAAAQAWGCSDGFLSGVICGDRRPSSLMLRSLGMELREVYVPIGTALPGIAA